MPSPDDQTTGGAADPQRRIQQGSPGATATDGRPGRRAQAGELHAGRERDSHGAPSNARAVPLLEDSLANAGGGLR